MSKNLIIGFLVMLFAVNLMAQKPGKKRTVAKKHVVAKAEIKKKTVAKKLSSKRHTTYKGKKQLKGKTVRKKPVIKSKKLVVADPVPSYLKSYRGSLPWPVANAVIKLPFGNYTVPASNKSLRPIQGYNPGLTLETDPEATVKAVAEGEVTSIFDIDGNMAVIISHGNFSTTYSNLSDVEVSRGQTITAGQVLGKAVTNRKGNGEIEFVVMATPENSKTRNLDPEPLLKKIL